MTRKKQDAAIIAIALLFSLTVVGGYLLITALHKTPPVFIPPAAWCFNPDDMGESLPCVISDRQIDI